MNRLNLHAIEMAIAVFVLSFVTQLGANPVLDIQTPTWKKAAAAGVLSVIVYIKAQVPVTKDHNERSSNRPILTKPGHFL